MAGGGTFPLQTADGIVPLMDFAVALAGSNLPNFI